MTVSRTLLVHNILAVDLHSEISTFTVQVHNLLSLGNMKKHDLFPVTRPTPPPKKKWGVIFEFDYRSCAHKLHTTVQSTCHVYVEADDIMVTATMKMQSSLDRLTKLLSVFRSSQVCVDKHILDVVG